MVDDVCEKAGFILRIVAQLFFYIRIIVPILLIVMVIFDLVKVVVGQADEKAKKEATGKIVKRLAYAVLVFLVPTLINLVFRFMEESLVKGGKEGSTATHWISCWTRYYK